MKTARTFTVVFLSAFMLQSMCIAQHLRIFACAIANDSAGAFLGGSSNGSGLYQSDDTGKTWKHLGWDNIKCYSMDMVQSSNGRILYEATGLGVLRSTDYGEHWKQLTDWRVSEVMDVAVNQKNPDEIYIATAHGPWRTMDGGKAWQSIHLPSPNNEPYLARLNCYIPGGWDVMNEDCLSGHDLVMVDPQDESMDNIAIIANLQFGYYVNEKLVHDGVYVNGKVTLAHREVWSLKRFLVTP